MMRDLLIIAVVLVVAVAGAVDQVPGMRGAIDSERAWEKAAEARDAAGRDEHPTAIAAFIAALNHDGRLVGTVCDELASQKLWNEEPDKAIFYFQRYLARHPGESNRDARKGLALAYSWSGRQPEAIALYRELVAEDPSDLEASLGLGRALIWDNRLHEGFRVLRAVEQDHADTGEARAAGSFLLTVLDEYDPHLDLRWDGIWDSDDLTIHRLTALGRTNLGSALVEAGGGVAFYSQPDRPDINAPRVQLGIVTPLAHNWALHAYAWVDHFQSDGPLTANDPELDWTRVGGDAWLTWLATSRLRLDLGAGSQVIETYDAFAKKLHYEPVNLSADWRFVPAWTLSGTAQYASYSDGNERTRGAAQLLWHRPGTWDWTAGGVVYYMDYAIPYPGGYWAPDWVRNGSLTLRIKRRWARVIAQIDGSYGLEREAGSDAIPVGGFHGHVGWRMAPGWLLSGDVAYSRSRFTSDSGYNRTTATVRVRALF